MKRLFSILNTIIILMMLGLANASAGNLQVNEGDIIDCRVPYSADCGGMKSRILFTPGELTQAGIRAGEIRALSFKIANTAAEQNMDLQQFRVMMVHAEDSLMSDQGDYPPLVGNWTVCYGGNPNALIGYNPNTGDNPWKKIVFTTPFTWNGENSIIIEVAWTNNVNRVLPRGEGVRMYAERIPRYQDEAWNLYSKTIYDEATWRPVPNIDAFNGLWNAYWYRPIVKLDAQNFAPKMLVDKEVNFHYIDLNTLSMSKKVWLSVLGANPAEGDITITPAANAYVSLDGVTYVTAPNTLTIPYTNGGVEDKPIYCKIMGSETANPDHRANVVITAGNMSETVVLKAKCSDNLFSEYCSSLARTRESSILKLTISKNDEEILTNGTYSGPTTNMSLEGINNPAGYTSYVESVVAPRLKAGDEYKLTVIPGTTRDRLRAGNIIVFIDADRNGKLTGDERVMVKGYEDGADKIEGLFVMPKNVFLSGNNRALMRVIFVENQVVGPCVEYWSSGETEDYAVELANMEDIAFHSLKTHSTGSDSYRPGEKEKIIAEFDVNFNGGNGNFEFTEYKFTPTGTTDVNDIEDVTLYYLGKDTEFNPEKAVRFDRLSTIAAGENVMSLANAENGANKVLPTGRNKFVLTCNVKRTATPGHYIDITSNSIKIKKDNTETTHAFANGNADDKHLIRNRLGGKIFVGGAPTGNPLNYYPDLVKLARELKILGADSDIEVALNGDIIMPDNQSVLFEPINFGREYAEDEEPKDNIKLTFYPTKKLKIEGNVDAATDNSFAHLILFLGLGNVNFDGRINKIGSENALTITNNGQKGVVTPLLFFGLGNDKMNNINIRNTNFKGKQVDSILTSGLFFYDAFVDTSKIINNTFSGFRNGIYVIGSSETAKYANNMTIEGNTFGVSDTKSTLTGSGIRLAGSNNVKIENNKFCNIVNNRSERGCEAINLFNVNSNVSINNNHIDSIFSINNARASGIFLASKGNTNITIFGNIIRRVLGNGSDGMLNVGLMLNAGKKVSVYHNLVYLEGNRSKIPGAKPATPALNSSSMAVMIGDNAEEISMRNNIFVNNLEHDEENVNAKAYVIVAGKATSLIDTDYNAYYAGGTNPMLAFFGDNKPKIEDWRLVADSDKNSLYQEVKILEGKDIPFGTLDGNSAIDDKFNVPAIDGFENTRDIHGNPRPAFPGKVTIGVDQVLPTFDFEKQMPSEITEQCAPYTQKLSVEVAVNGFSDGIKREFTKEGNFQYQWKKNGQNVPNIDPATQKAVNSNVYHAEITESNIAKPDIFMVNVSLVGSTKTSDPCKIKAEGTIQDKTVYPEGPVVLCSDNGVAKFEVTAIGTVTGYQWQKLIDNTWTDLEGDDKHFLVVSLQNEKYGIGKYRAKIFDGEFKCNKGKDFYSQEFELHAVYPVENVVLTSKEHDLAQEIVICEGNELNIELDTKAIKGDVVGYRWEKKVDGAWETVDLESNTFLSESGFHTQYTEPEQSGEYRIVAIGNSLCAMQEAYSNEISINVNPYVYITEQPQADVVCKGKDIIIKVATDANEPVYQWLKNGKPISINENETADSSVFIIKNAQFEDAGYYSVIIKVSDCLKDKGDKMTSETVSIVVMNETQITRQPENQQSLIGKRATFSVETNAIGDSPLYIAGYQWFKQYVREGKVIDEALEESGKYAGTKANVLHIQNVEEKDAGYYYYVVIQGLCGDTVHSNKVVLKTTSLGFTHLDNKKKACDGDEVTLSALAESTQPDDKIIYEWHFVNGDNDEIINGTTEKTTIIASKYTEGKYYVKATLEKAGTTITSNFIVLEVGTKPQITKPIDETNTKAGELFTLTSQATGNNIEYKWYRNNTLIPNAISPNLTTSEKQAGTFTYKVVAINECGKDSSEAKVEVAKNLSYVEEIEEYGFSVSNIIPNPVVSNVAKFSVNSEIGAKAEITIVDAAGRTTEFFSGNISGSKEFSINTSRYANGAYYVVISIDGKKITRQFIVER